jgi:hypothetical protein
MSITIQIASADAVAAIYGPRLGRSRLDPVGSDTFRMVQRA